MNSQPTKQMLQLRLESQWNQMLYTRPQLTQLKYSHQGPMHRINKKLENLIQDVGREAFLSPKMIYLMSLR